MIIKRDRKEIELTPFELKVAHDEYKRECNTLDIRALNPLNPESKMMKVLITDFIDENHRSHYWYGGECAKIMYKGYTAEIRANGDVYAEYVVDGETKAYVKDKNNAGFFYVEMKQYLKDDAALYEAINEGSLLSHLLGIEIPSLLETVSTSFSKVR